MNFTVSKLLSISLLLFCLLSGRSPAQDWKTVANGVEHAQVRREFSGKPVNINLLRVDLKKVRLDVHHAIDAAIGLERTSSIAARKGAIAAINAGFFRLDASQWAGDAAGVLEIDGRLLSEPNGERTQLWINNGPLRSDVYFARTGMTQSVRFGSRQLDLTGINRERKANDLILYTPEFHATTLTTGDGVEVPVIGVKVGSTMHNIGNASIPRNGYVISASGTFADALAQAAKEAERVTLVRTWSGAPGGLSTNDPKTRNRLDIVAGVPQLVAGGRVDITWEREKSNRAFVESRHPRTAVAKLKDGKFLMLTADGRTEESAGLDLYDLAAYMLELGATDAMNLDGGGSTTMFLGGKVVNKPSDKEGERKVGDAILVTLRKKK